MRILFLLFASIVRAIRRDRRKRREEEQFQQQHQQRHPQQFQQQQFQPQFQPQLQNQSRDMNVHYNSQPPSQCNNVNNMSHAPVHNGAIHRVPAPYHHQSQEQSQYGSDVKHNPEMAYTGGFDGQLPQYV